MKGNSIQLYLLGLLATVLLSGCMEGRVEDILPEDVLPVRLHFSRPDLGSPVSLTRSTTSEALPAGATVRIAAYFRKAGTPQVTFLTTEPTYQATYRVEADGSLSPCTVDANGKYTGPGTALDVRRGLYDFYAVSPARTLAIPVQDPPITNYQITDIPHKEDVMSSFVRGVTVSASANMVTLRAFSRKCALVVFNVEPDLANAVPIRTLRGTKLVLKRMSTSGAALLATEAGPITPTRGEADNIKAQVTFEAGEFTALDAPNPQGLNKTKGAVLPRTAGPFDVEIDVERNGATAHLTAVIDRTGLAFQPGKRYVFTLRVKNNESALFMRVLDWNEYVVSDPDVGTPVPSHPDPDIIPGVGIPIQVAEWKDIQWSGSGNAGVSPFITIDQRIADAYKAKFFDTVDPSTDNYPNNLLLPFQYDEAFIDGTGLDLNGNSTNYTVNAPYVIEVEDIQNKTKYAYSSGDVIRYCYRKGDGWRVPMAIELFAMWDKCKGNDPHGNATDDEEASTALGEKFIDYYYWSSSVFKGEANHARVILGFVTGRSQSTPTTSGEICVRCVREVKVSP